MTAARDMGILGVGTKDGRIDVRLHSRLVDAAKRTSGITSTTALIEYALAKAALDQTESSPTAVPEIPAETGAWLEDFVGTIDPDFDITF